MLRIHVVTLRRWIRERKIRAIRFPGGDYRIPQEEVDRLRQPVEVVD
jgi:excisionase family DNA binding protein